MLLKAHQIRDEVAGIRIIELRRPDGAPLQRFAAGAHVDVAAGGVSRQYSLVNSPAERDRYVIAVAREPASRGGSRWLHDELASGDLVEVGEPRCTFVLVEDAPHTVLIAGGIGFTPLWCMAHRLAAIGASWELHYAVRDPQVAALLPEIVAATQATRTLYSRTVGDGRRMDIAALVRAAPAAAHFYCCGPLGMIDDLRAAASALPGSRVHVELFTAVEPAATEGGYRLKLARSGREIAVEPGQTILDALRGAGMAASYSCREGVCGTCETRVLAGTPDHRDAILTDAERAAGDTMMICCSGSLTAELVLDL